MHRTCEMMLPGCFLDASPTTTTTTLLNPHSSHKVTSGPGIYQGVMQTAESKLHSHWWWEGLTIPNAWGAGSTQRCSRKAHYPPPKAAGEASVPRAQVSGARLSQDAVAGMHRGRDQEAYLEYPSRCTAIAR